MAEKLNVDFQKMEEKNLEQQKEVYEEKKNILKTAIENMASLDPKLGDYDDFAALLAMPEDQFSVIAPIFLQEAERSSNNRQDRLAIVQALNIIGATSQDVEDEYYKVVQVFDEELGDVMSRQKRDFLKQILGIIYNTIAETEGIAKKVINIPIELAHKDAKLPTYAHLSDAGMDIYALEDITIAPGETKLIPTGVKVALPTGYEFQVRPKSGISLKSKLRIANAPGTIDSGYRDEIGIIVDNIEPFIKNATLGSDGKLSEVEFGSSHTIGKGQKIAQLVLCETPKAKFYEVAKVAEIGEDRGGGFGSTGLE